MKKYVIGIDYGTLSARALLLDLTNGEETAVYEYVYRRPLLTAEDFDGTAPEASAALQDPQDYLDALRVTIRGVLKESGVNAADIVGIGIDVTSSTVLPVDINGEPLCLQPEFQNEPQAYVKLWKHHGAQYEADAITALAESQNMPWLPLYGNKVSSEWFFPKLYEVFRKAPKLYDAMFRYVEIADWLVWKLTGQETHSACMAGYKSLWKGKYPEKSFWEALDPGFADVIGTKVSEEVQPTGTKAGELTQAGAELTGLLPGTAVAVPIIDAHAALPAAGIVDDGKLMMIIGTSTCHIVMNREEKEVRGICGSVMDGVAPGYAAYEAGQTCVGDGLSWFIQNCVPESYTVEAREAGISIFDYLNEKAANIRSGENRVLVLDWWNGNRSPLADFDLSGLILGLTLKTKPEEIYRAMIEATAFGTKMIVDLYTDSGVEIRELYASGGIPRKNPFFMQIYADVLGKEITIAKSRQAGSLGSAIFAAVSSGYFASLPEAAAVLAEKCTEVYVPNPENTEKYAKAYAEYVELCRYFGQGGNDVMKRLLHL